ncbi:hypothetical protein H310_14116 [Aphanomyces invadans]|uniref:Uncharacterized protein n=1 Tax=Aphanomyces invadans TaxID=157072 RepID=A0A024TCG4_9STRA|nr:hypothetical protein H310_14116 [Aphanomyces invadans]ETV91281.1 hypothetical protein H310_14116 [Aphanomyces invadans]|eukprot:XP_008880118.1 hypothetical protein H310_14116 [Aphanomyces invadans]
MFVYVLVNGYCDECPVSSAAHRVGCSGSASRHPTSRGWLSQSHCLRPLCYAGPGAARGSACVFDGIGVSAPSSGFGQPIHVDVTFPHRLAREFRRTCAHRLDRRRAALPTRRRQRCQATRISGRRDSRVVKSGTRRVTIAGGDDDMARWSVPVRSTCMQARCQPTRMRPDGGSRRSECVARFFRGSSGRWTTDVSPDYLSK